MAEENKSGTAADEQALSIEHIKKRLDMFDQRLHNIDSVATALVERVMKQPIALNVTCPNCGKNIEISLIGTGKPGR